MIAAPKAVAEDRVGAEQALDVRNIVVRYRVRRGVLEAVSDVSFSIGRGETLGLVGESGSGKSSVARAVMHLPPPTSGTVELGGRRITGLSPKELRAERRRVHLIFQDPLSALNPRRRVRAIVGEGLALAGVPKDQIEVQVRRMLELVGMDPEIFGGRRPHELSGGQCQRIAIARGLVLNPTVLVCDEPIASLDVSIQGQVLNLLEDMRAEFGLSMLFISHDLSVVHNISDRIAVMYLGKLVELGSSHAVTHRPAHPYTAALIDAIPFAYTEQSQRVGSLRGEIPSPLRPPSGCRFHTRCPFAQERCRTDAPALRPVGPDREVACHFPLVEDAR